MRLNVPKFLSQMLVPMDISRRLHRKQGGSPEMLFHRASFCTTTLSIAAAMIAIPARWLSCARFCATRLQTEQVKEYAIRAPVAAQLNVRVDWAARFHATFARTIHVKKHAPAALVQRVTLILNTLGASSSLAFLS